MQGVVLYLRLRDSVEYIPLKMQRSWRNWREQWLYIAHTRNGLKEYDLPMAAPVSNDTWAEAALTSSTT